MQGQVLVVLPRDRLCSVPWSRAERGGAVPVLSDGGTLGRRPPSVHPNLPNFK